ncbi:hypothetical protein F4781DRAFT_432698 [Annulohypoxylon bovei var. microspora]|nr:hypothetical protein F4781DRAFT_432698 [Annulohypoxylon bovei var. microspora]
MKSSSLFGTLATAILLPATQATWCQFFYDSACTQKANGDVNFDCANHNVLGSGGGFAQCHGTSHNKQQCLINRCTDESCVNHSGLNVDADQSCINMYGAGPYYQLYLIS